VAETSEQKWGEALKKSSAFMEKPCVPIREKMKNRPTLFPHGAERMVSALARRW